VLVVAGVGLWVVTRNEKVRKTLSRNSSGYFKLDGKEGLLGGGGTKGD
jgi:hypothetical protein